MSDRFTAAEGRKVVSRASAEELGNVTRFVVDAKQRRIVSLVIGKRRNARLVNWESLSGFGADAVMVTDEESLHEPQDDHEQAAANGDLELLGRRALSHLGNELGKIDDITFDPDTGALEAIIVDDHETPAGSLLGAGSYAVILRANDTDAGTKAN
jgi:uncharacterized protein YrrD